MIIIKFILIKWKNNLNRQNGSKNLIIFILKSFKRIDIKIIDALKAFFYYNLIVADLYLSCYYDNLVLE